MVLPCTCVRMTEVRTALLPCIYQFSVQRSRFASHMISRSKEIKYAPMQFILLLSYLFQCCSVRWLYVPAILCRKPEFMMFQVNQDDTEGLKAEIEVSPSLYTHSMAPEMILRTEVRSSLS